MKISRRNFIKRSAQMTSAALFSGVFGFGTLSGCSTDDNDGHLTGSAPNILLIMVDQMQTPPEGYGADEGAAQGLKEVLGFRNLSLGNEYVKYFPGLMRLRQNSVVMRKNYTASAACVPSRTAIMTGQYPSLTGVDQTDGLYKTASDVPFLDPEGTPTIGHWFRAAGYSTHYFGKWHVSEAEPPKYLEPWGFSEWEKSYPEPHGGTADNTGTYRDVEFADNVKNFLENQRSNGTGNPWFAVASLVNPHDCSAYPINWQTPPTPLTSDGNGVVSWANYPPPVSIPDQGQMSLTGGIHENNQYRVDLNPDGFPQNNSSLPRTYNEALDDKPSCQKDYSLKWGLAYGASTNYGLTGTGITSPLPFQLSEDAAEWSLKYNQFYFYCQYLAELQIRKILSSLDENGHTNNTIVVFLSDHGDMTGAHGGMIQKWHNAYEESIRVPMVFSSPLLNANKNEIREIIQPTSSIDLAPTLLGLAGYSGKRLKTLMGSMSLASNPKTFAGADLSGHVRGKNSGTITGADGRDRNGVFFMTNDMITEMGSSYDPTKWAQYQAFISSVNTQIDAGLDLARGPVRQPNNVRALCTGNWKMVHYVDPNSVESDEWELYCLKSDPVEQANLVDFRTGEVRDDVSVPGMTLTELKQKNLQLRKELSRQESVIIG
ncbi:sulfatase-like hydrolase/transferase [Desulforegula conservatrix]|uniref:sulfatase-like hydrolase/transferase n=1 Tax=Desulforegula conservatrix TaxID=153026 RepID=UPI00040A483C|nr:sulfatase-like hydrolase/transferase [Desulforegula conservatrix]